MFSTVSIVKKQPMLLNSKPFHIVVRTKLRNEKKYFIEREKEKKTSGKLIALP